MTKRKGNQVTNLTAPVTKTKASSAKNEKLKKLTVYVDEETYYRLEDALVRLKRMTGGGRKLVTKSKVTDIALVAVLDELENEGEMSRVGRHMLTNAESS